jgi:ankyrin repeat protein
MRPAALLPVAAALLAAGCQKAEPPRTEARPSPAASPPPAVTAATQAPAAAQRPAPQPAAAPVPAPAADGYAARTKQLLEAAEKGRVSQLMELLQKGANVNDKDDDGQTALHRAAARGHKTAVVALLTMGADTAERDGKGRTALMTAAEAGSAEVVKLLVAPGAAAALAGEVFKSAGGGKLPAGLDKLGARLQDGADGALDQTDPAGRTALMLAAAGGHADCVKALLPSIVWERNAARIARPDKKGQSALMLAAGGGHAETVEAMLDPYYAKRRPYLTPLSVADLRRALGPAEAGGHKPVVRLLWSEAAGRAAFEGDLATVKEALEKYPDLPAPALLKQAVSGGSLPVVQHLMGQYKGKLAEEKLRLVGASDADKRAYSALHDAVQGRHTAVVTALIDPDWWQDKAALRAFIRFDPGAAGDGSQAVTGSYFSSYFKIQPELVKLIEDRLKQVEAVKK